MTSDADGQFGNRNTTTASGARTGRKDRNDRSLFQVEGGGISEDQEYYLRRLNENQFSYANRKEAFKKAASYISESVDEPWKRRSFITPYPGCGVSFLLYEKIIDLYNKVDAGIQGEALLPVIKDARRSRRSTARHTEGLAHSEQLKTAAGMRVGGVYASVFELSWGEASYDVLTSHPVPKANSWPLVADQRQALLYRFPPKVMDYCGPRVNTSPSLDYYDVLRTLDRCIRFEQIPVTPLKLSEFKAAVSSDQSARNVSNSYLLMTEFHNTRSKSSNAQYGEFLRHSPANNIKSPFYDEAVEDTARVLRNADIAAEKELFSDEEYIIRAKKAYQYDMKADLCSDYRDFWPNFPYVCKSNPNYYFENLRVFLEDVHPIFGLYGNDCLLQGWNAFPQSIVGVRKPVGWYGHSIAQRAKAHMPDIDNMDEYVAMRPSALKTIRILPYTFPVWWWTIHQADKNVALCLGRMTGNVIALDIDITDRMAVGKVIKVIEKTLGISPFIRVGNYPKVMLLYRLPEGVTMTSKSIPLGNDLGMIEILSEGKVITAFGVHHQLHTTFQWIGGKNPAENSPKEAPVVTLSDLEDFLVGVSEDVAPIEAKYLPKVVTEDGSRVVRGKVMVGKHGVGGTNALYQYDDFGRVCDGRSAYVRNTAFLSLIRHKEDIERYGAKDCVSQCIADAVATLKKTMLLDGGRWQEETIEHIVSADIENMLDKLGTDPEFTELFNSDIRVTRDGILRSNKQADHTRVMRKDSRVRALFGNFRTNETPDVSFREVKGDSAESSTNVRVREPSYNPLSPNGRDVSYPDDSVRFNIAQDLSGHLARFLRCVYNGQDVPKAPTLERRPLVTSAMIEDIATRDPREQEAPKQEAPAQTQEQKNKEAEELRAGVMVIDVPTGSGKTSRLIEAIVNDPRTIEPQEWYDEKDVEQVHPKMVNRPFVIAMPNYNNIEEAVSRARILCMKKGMDDETLIKELLAQGCVKDEADAIARLPEIRQTIENSTRDESLPAPKIQVYRGREKSNCAFTYELKQLAAAHQPADRLCAATVKDSKTGEDKEVFCEHYATCSYIKQKEDIKSANIIFLVHSFLGNNALPESIKQARALIIDEQIHHQFMHTQFMEREQFDISAEIFNLWDMEYADTPEKVKKYKAHNDYMYAQREAIPMRDWLIDLVIACARERKDPAFEIMNSTQRFDLEQWRAKERPDYDGNFSDIYEAEEEEGQPEDVESAEPRVFAPIGPVLNEEDQQKAVMSARQRARKAYTGFVREAERDSEGAIIEKDGFLSPRQVLHNAIGFLCSLFKQDVRIEPGMANTRIRAKLSQPGLINAEAEREMWRAIQERISLIEMDNARIFREKAYEESLYAFLEDFGVKRGSEGYEELLDENPIVARRVARIEQEMCSYRHKNQPKITNPSLIDPRFQFVSRRKETERGIDMVPMLRFSWRTQPGWEKTPLMLMDASADRRIIEKIFAPRPVYLARTREDKGRILNMEVVVVTDHLYSNNALIASKDASIAQKVKAARNLSNVRDAISMVCANHAGSRVVFGSPKNVRQAILTAWEDKPSQLDSCHFGAMRGIDVYKKHMALLCIGRMEPPIEDIDAMAACFSYDDDVYEQPFNINGNGCEDAEGERPLYQKKYPRMIHMRARETERGEKKEVATFMTSMVEGEWGRIVQNQCREEEINQAVGRLRPVYRTPSDRPTCYILSSCIPEHLIVDDVVSLYDLIGTDGRTNTRIGSKLEEGIPLPEIVVRERLAKWHLVTLLRLAARFDSMLCPREIFEQASHLLPSELRSEEAIVNVLRTFHFKEDKIINERGDIEDRAPCLAISDGWYGVEVRHPVTNVLQEVWTPIAVYQDIEEATARIEERYSSVVERVLHVPQKIVCYSKEGDAVDAVAQSGDEEQSLATLVSIRNAVEKMMSEEIVEIIGGREVRTKAIAPTCFEGQTLLSDIPLYNMTNPLLDAIMQAGSALSPEAMAKVAEMQARVRYVKMTYEQIMAFMAIQQVWGDTAEDIAMRLNGATLSSDGIPKAYLSIRSKMAQLESEAKDGSDLTPEQVKSDEKRFAEITAARADASQTTSAPDSEPTAKRSRRRGTGQSAIEVQEEGHEDCALEDVTA